MPEAPTLREHCERRLAAMKPVREPMEAAWKEIATLAQPMRSRFLNTETGKKANQRLNTKLRDGHGIRAFRVLTNGMTSGLSSPSRPWFKLATQDEDLMKSGAVKEWLGKVEQALYSFFARTNFYTAAQVGYGELGLFGTEATVMVEHPVMGAVCHTLTAGEYWIACNDANMPDTLYRRVPMTVTQVIGAFATENGARDPDWSVVSNTVKSAYDASRYEDMVNVWHAIEPNNSRLPGAIDGPNKPFRSVWWDENEGTKAKLLRNKGFDEQPFWAPRWETTGADVYGTSPGMDALPDLRELMMQAKRKGEATDMAIFPPMGAPTGLAAAAVNLTPKGLTFASSVDIAALKPLYMVPYQAIEVIRNDVEGARRAVDDAAYASVFNAITQMDQATPPTAEQVRGVQAEKLTQLGPVVERVNGEKLQVAIDRAFGILLRAGVFPPPPPETQGQHLRIEFVSILTQMQRVTGAASIERFASFVGNLAAENPPALDKFNVDQAIDDYGAVIGVPPDLVRTDDEVAAIRKGRQQQQAQAQAAQAAPAAKDGAMAARLLSETDTGNGQSMLAQLAQGGSQ